MLPPLKEENCRGPQHRDPEIQWLSFPPHCPQLCTTAEQRRPGQPQGVHHTPQEAPSQEPRAIVPTLAKVGRGPVFPLPPPRDMRGSSRPCRCTQKVLCSASFWASHSHFQASAGMGDPASQTSDQRKGPSREQTEDSHRSVACSVGMHAHTSTHNSGWCLNLSEAASGPQSQWATLSLQGQAIPACSLHHHLCCLAIKLMSSLT